MWRELVDSLKGLDFLFEGMNERRLFWSITGGLGGLVLLVLIGFSFTQWWHFRWWQDVILYVALLTIIVATTYVVAGAIRDRRAKQSRRDNRPVMFALVASLCLVVVMLVGSVFGEPLTLPVLVWWLILTVVSFAIYARARRVRLKKVEQQPSEPDHDEEPRAAQSGQQSATLDAEEADDMPSDTTPPAESQPSSIEEILASALRDFSDRLRSMDDKLGIIVNRLDRDLIEQEARARLKTYKDHLHLKEFLKNSQRHLVIAAVYATVALAWFYAFATDYASMRSQMSNPGWVLLGSIGVFIVIGLPGVWYLYQAHYHYKRSVIDVEGRTVRIVKPSNRWLDLQGLNSTFFVDKVLNVHLHEPTRPEQWIKWFKNSRTVTIDFLGNQDDERTHKIKNVRNPEELRAVVIHNKQVWDRLLGSGTI